MTVLPIFVRELRGRGRGAANYWGRAGVAAVGMLVCVPALMGSGAVALPALGRGAYNILLGTAFFLCCGACLLTADALTRERREGTLLLLLITRLSSWDVLLAKFASHGLASFAGLFALLPILTLPLLAGGTSAAEAFRNAAALGNTLFLALAAGLCASSMSPNRPRAAATSLALVLAVLLAPWVGGGYVSLASPLRTILQSTDTAYKAWPVSFWLSLAMVQFVAWGLLWWGAARLRRAPNDPGLSLKPGAREAIDSSAATSGDSSVVVTCPYCGRKNASEASHCHECGTDLHPKPRQLPRWNPSTAPSPLHWLVARQRGVEPMLWVAAVITASQFAVLAASSRFLAGGMGAWYVGFNWGVGLIASGMAGSLIAAGASRFVFEEARTGGLELLLTTPVGAEKLAITQWDMLKRMIRFPLLLMLLPILFRAVFVILAGYSRPDMWRQLYAMSILLGVADTILSVGALCWLAMWLAFQGKSRAQTICWSVVLGNGVPFALSLTASMLYRVLLPQVTPLSSRWPGIPLLLGSIAPQLVTLLFYLLVIRSVRWQLLQHSPAEPFNFRNLRTLLLGDLSRVVHRARRWPASIS